MPKKYYYDQATCSYEPVPRSLTSVVLRGCIFLTGAFAMAFAMLRWYKTSFPSPRELELFEDNKKLKEYYSAVQKKIGESTALLSRLQERDDTLYRVLLNTPPLSATHRNAGIGGIDKYAHLGQDTLIADTLARVDNLNHKILVQGKSFDHLFKLARAKKARLRSMPILAPVSKNHLKKISATFGMRLHPVFRIPKMHEGIDFAAPKGTPIYAAADGYVKNLKHSSKGYGNHIQIEHGHGFQTLYAHMNTIFVRVKQRVVKGQKIGAVGTTGHSTAPHLHYSVYRNGKPVNPMHYFVGNLTPQEYEAVRKQALKELPALCSNF